MCQSVSRCFVDTQRHPTKVGVIWCEWTEWMESNFHLISLINLTIRNKRSENPVLYHLVIDTAQLRLFNPLGFFRQYSNKEHAFRSSNAFQWIPIVRGFDRTKNRFIKLGHWNSNYKEKNSLTTTFECSATEVCVRVKRSRSIGHHICEQLYLTHVDCRQWSSHINYFIWQKYAYMRVTHMTMTTTTKTTNTAILYQKASRRKWLNSNVNGRNCVAKILCIFIIRLYTLCLCFAKGELTRKTRKWKQFQSFRTDSFIPSLVNMGNLLTFCMGDRPPPRENKKTKVPREYDAIQ